VATARWLKAQKLMMTRQQQRRRSQSKSLGGKMFDFRRATVFLFGTPLLKAQND